jgi:mannose-1-phosphate guanylyltransferase
MFAPALAPLLSAPAAAGQGDGALARSLDAIYPTLPKISVDYAIMERHRNVVMAKGAFDWDDVGSWTAAAKFLPRDDSGNAVVGRVHALDSRGNVVVAGDGREIALLGVEGIVVVQHGDATLVCSRDRAPDLKALLAARKP